MFKIIGIVIAIGTVIAVGLNCFNQIPNVTAGDWLGFWGAYIGGIATLGGVLLTLWKGENDKREAKEQREKDKEEVKKKEKPVIVPLRREFDFIVNSQGNIILKLNENLEKNIVNDDSTNVLEGIEKLFNNWDKDRFIAIDILNIGKEHALNLSIIYKSIKSLLITELNSEYISEQQYKEYFKKDIKDIPDNQIIKVSKNDEYSTICLPRIMMRLLENIIQNMNNKNKKDRIRLDLSYKKVIICEIEFNYQNIYTNPYHDNYLMYAEIFLPQATDGSITLTFEKIN